MTTTAAPRNDAQQSADVRVPVQGRLTTSEAFAAALRGEPCRVVGIGESVAETLPFRRWTGDADASDHVLLRRCCGATVDLGCGPGRMTHALLSLGVKALGIDLVEQAVQLTRERGAMALQRDIFTDLPGEGRWTTALLADGNIGIGGDPVRLLRRAASLVTPDGRIIVDLAAPGGPIRVHRIGLEVGGRSTRRFPWAIVPADQLELLAEQTALRILEIIDHEGRWFATLQRRGSS
ncbi:MAG: methyltransferase domain-containing protein [Nocardioidaceae bacterium]|nr:methyltransferase domain-containing protein [Nocardioidaceae bacterium]